MWATLFKARARELLIEIVHAMMADDLLYLAGLSMGLLEECLNVHKALLLFPIVVCCFFQRGEFCVVIQPRNNTSCNVIRIWNEHNENEQSQAFPI